MLKKRLITALTFNNGILYRTDKKGLIPTLLSSWFDKRKEFWGET